MSCPSDMTAPPAGALEACLALLEKATAGSWHAMIRGDYGDGNEADVNGPDGNEVEGAEFTPPGYGNTIRGQMAEADARAIAAAVNFLRTHGPALLAALRLREWRPVAGHEGRYEVSSDGLIRKITGEAVGTWFNQDGYLRARLSGPRVTVLVHRAVATAFLPNPQSHPTVNHLNHRRDDNRAENLEWCSQAENLSHMDAAGRRGKPMLGRRAPSALLSEDKVREIRRTYAIGSMSHAALAQEFGVSKRAIGRCINRETYGDVE